MTRPLLERGDPRIRTYFATSSFDIRAVHPDQLYERHEYAYLKAIARQWSERLTFTPELPPDVAELVMTRPPVFVVYWPRRTCKSVTFPLGGGGPRVATHTTQRDSPYAQVNTSALHIGLRQSDAGDALVDARLLYDTGPDDIDERMTLDRGCSYKFHGQLEAHMNPCRAGSLVWFKCGIVKLP